MTMTNVGPAGVTFMGKLIVVSVQDGKRMEFKVRAIERALNSLDTVFVVEDEFVDTTQPDPLITCLVDELAKARNNWPPMNSAHEAYGVLAEELDEYWEHVKTNQKRRDLAAMRKELIQIAAMALRAITDTIDQPASITASREKAMAEGATHYQVPMVRTITDKELKEGPKTPL